MNISNNTTGVSNSGTLTLNNVNFSGNTTDVSNAGILSLTGENTFGSKITGTAGTVTNTGTLNIGATNLDVALTNNNILNLGEGTLGKAITGTGTITTTGDVSSNASYLGNAVTNDNYTLTLTGGELDKAITGGDVAIDGVVTSNASIASAIGINSGKSLTIAANNIKADVANAGTLKLGAGTLAQAISGGNVIIDGDVVSASSIISDVTINASHALEIAANKIGAVADNKTNILTNNGTVILNDGELTSTLVGNVEIKSGATVQSDITNFTGTNAGTLTNNGTFNMIGNIVKDITGSGTTVLSNEGSYVSVVGNRIVNGILDTNGKSINMQSLSSSVSYDTLSVGTLNLEHDISLMLDSNIKTASIDRISATSVTGDGKINMLLNIPNRIDTVLTNPNITLDPINMTAGEARTALAKALQYDGQSITSPIFEYTTSYDKNTGLISIVKKEGTEGINKSLYSSTAIEQTTASTVAQIANIAMDKLDMATYDELQGLAAGDMPKASNAWVKVMGFDDDVDFKHFNGIDSKAYTIAGGFNTDKVQFNDVNAAFGIYGGYIGGRQKYTGNKIEQDGGYIGLSSELTKGNAFLISTVNGGFINNEAENMYGTDKFDTRWFGIGLKGGYNYALTDTWTLQPNVYAGYTFVNTEDYTSKSGVRINNDNLNFFEIDPGFKLTKQIDNGWLGYIQGKYAIVMDNGGETTVNEIVLPNISAKNYFEYGFGMNKSLTDAWSLNGEINRRDGGRSGWNGSVEFKYNF